MKAPVLLVASFTAVAAVAAARTDGMPAAAGPAVSSAVARAAASPHPRLFAAAAGFEALRARAASDEYVKLGAEKVRQLADRLLAERPVTREMEGRRLLHVSRRALYRINTLALAYRLYGDRRHLERAVAEMRAVCAFSDWNPAHFLDVGEMSLDVATGYDWLYDELDEPVRGEIAAGLRRHGLDASRIPDWWITAGNNWGQVCHAGVLAAALALAEERPDETARFVQRCVDNLPRSMKALAPNGNYPEGPGYWNYGVEFNFVALALLEGTLGSDFGLAALPGFRQTGAYPDLVTGPTGRTFNYADGGSGRETCPATWWFARRFGDRSILAYFERAAYRRYCIGPKAHGNRMFAYGLFFVERPPAELEIAHPLVWDGGGPVPIAVQRSSWTDPDAMFVGLKGGSPSANHGHMDGGSFILEAQGVRWALDLGAESYHQIERRGMTLWNMGQASQRWTIFRLGTSGHNTLMLDGCQQSVKGFGKVLAAKEGPPHSVELDLTSLYTNATKVVRLGEMAADGRSYVLTDRIEGLAARAPIRWTMFTAAAVAPEGDGLVLRQHGRDLRLTATGPGPVAWETAPADGPNEWDSPNRGITRISFVQPMPAAGAAEIKVSFRSGRN